MRTRYNFAGLTVTYRTAMTDKGVLEAPRADAFGGFLLLRHELHGVGDLEIVP